MNGEANWGTAAARWLRRAWGRPAAARPQPRPALVNHRITPLSLLPQLQAANRWRSQYNPLRGLDLPRAASLLEAGERGDYGELQWTYRLIEKRDPTLCALLARYDGGLLKLDWTVKTVSGPGQNGVGLGRAGQFAGPAGASAGDAQAQAAVLREAYGRLDNLRQALQFLVSARFRGFAHLEKWFDPAGRIRHLEPVPQWHWQRDGLGGPWRYAPAGWGRGESGTVPVTADRFVIREVERPIDEIALLVHVRRNLCQKDWDTFVELYGVPAIFLIGPVGASQEVEDALAAKAEEVIGNYRGYLPAGSQLASVPVTARGVNPFRTYLRSLDENLVLAATGGKLSVLSEPGVGQQAGLVHWAVWREIMQAEALLVSEVLQQQFDAPLLAQAFPGAPILAYFELCATAETDVAAVCQQALTLSQAGYQIGAAELSEKTGYTLTARAGAKEAA